MWENIVSIMPNLFPWFVLGWMISVQIRLNSLKETRDIEFDHFKKFEFDYLEKKVDQYGTKIWDLVSRDQMTTITSTLSERIAILEERTKQRLKE